MTENQTYLETLFNRPFEYQPDIETLRSEHLPCSFTTSESNGEGNIIGIICRGQEDFYNITLPKELNQLEYLNLCDNKKLTQFFFEGSFPKLKHFDCSDSKITYLDFPKGFEALEYCDASRNEIDEFNFNGDMPSLTFLELSGNKIEEIYFNHECGELKYLYLIDNRLKNIRFSFPMPELEILHLRGNQLENLPQVLFQFTSLKELYLHGNPMTDIGLRIVGQGENHNSAEEVLAFLAGTKKSAVKFLHEAKMVLVGNGEVGKSSIRIKLLDESAPLPKKEERTPGLDISTYTIKGFYPPIPIDLESDSPPQQQFNAPINFDLNIWDFGGQGKYREVQQLFCSPKTLYLFVTACDDTPSNEDYVGFEYWMSMVNAYSFDSGSEKLSPVIHVVNKIDISEKPVNQLDIVELFPNIGGFEKISCKDLTNFDSLRNSIQNILPEVNDQIFTEPFPENWLNVKDALKLKESENHITFDHFLEICNENDLSRKEAQAWVKVLDRIGSVIYFGTDPELKNWVILNPIWVKQALYLALDSPLINNATITPNLFPFIWQNATPDEHNKLIALMCACKLCYLNTTNMGDNEYIVPSLLKAEIPVFPIHLSSPDFEIKFNFDPFIPAGTVNKLMVNLHQNIYNNFKWKSNVIFHKPESNSYVHVCENWEDKCIEIKLYGADLMSIYNLVVTELKTINTNLKNSRFIKRLDFQVIGKHEKGWFDIDTLKTFGADEFGFLWGESGSSNKVSQPKIFFSYAWGINDATGENRETIVDELYDSLDEEGTYQLMRDKKVAGYKKSIIEFMKEIGKGKLVVVVLSEKYLKSPNCMFELIEIYKKSGSEAEEFRKRVFPILLNDAKIFDVFDRINYVKHWKEQCEKLESAINELGLEHARSVFDDFESWIEIRNHIGKVASILGDLNTLNPKMLSENNFAEIKKAIEASNQG